ncbi:MAG: hypothetical protein IT353_13890 [Gemmatimonadaceae bacterium]|nr:hypothetical protein [Gemmatimonadaceae bacterium]
MYATLRDFLSDWEFESSKTQLLLDRLTDLSLTQSIYPGGRDIGRLAWHITQTLPEMMERTGLHVGGVAATDVMPARASVIASAYREAAASLAKELTDHWTDETLDRTDDMYGETWSRRMTLHALVAHQTHHRGQLSVLMRQAGLVVPGVYGPSREEWEQIGMTPPLV